MQRTCPQSVFEQQNRLSTALMHAIFTAETEGAEHVQPLYEAEARLKEACAPVNRAAYLKMNQQEIDGALGLAVMSTLDDCEQTAADTEKLLWQMAPRGGAVFSWRNGSRSRQNLSLKPRCRISVV